MPTYTLNLDIDPKTIPGENIILAKPVGTAAANLVWISFQPFESNTITWTEDYQVYASKTTVQAGAQIKEVSRTPYPATDGSYYQFDANYTFEGPESISGYPTVPVGTFGVVNAVPASQDAALTFGLAQVASRDGGTVRNGKYQSYYKSSAPSPLNALSLPAQQYAQFTPLTTVFIWVQGNLESSTVITQYGGKTAEADFGKATELSFTYNPNTARFEPSTSK